MSDSIRAGATEGGAESRVSLLAVVPYDVTMLLGAHILVTPNGVMRIKPTAHTMAADRSGARK